MRVSPTSGFPFMQAYEMATTYDLEPGTYFAVVFTDESGIEKDYVLSMCSRADADVRIRGFNVVNSSISK